MTARSCRLQVRLAQEAKIAADPFYRGNFCVCGLCQRSAAAERPCRFCCAAERPLLTFLPFAVSRLSCLAAKGRLKARFPHGRDQFCSAQRGSPPESRSCEHLRLMGGSSAHALTCFCRKLAVVEIGIEFPQLHELVVIALFDDGSLLHNEDVI